MGVLKLKKGITVEYDRENFIYHFYGLDTNEMKKVTSRAFSCLLGQNEWESIGKTILERFKAVQKEEIDPYYMVRGDMAELLVKDYIQDFYKKKNINVELKTWKKEEVKYDNFSSNDKYGGLIDIAIAKPQDFRAVIEVKSKSLKDYGKINESKGNIDEVLQGKFLSFLSQVDKCLMVYVFFTPNQEKQIKEYIETQKTIGYEIQDTMIYAKEIIDKLKFDYKNLKISIFKYDISKEKEEIKDQMKVAYNNLVHFKEKQTIAESYFTQRENLYLKDLAGHELTKEELEDNKPF